MKEENVDSRKILVLFRKDKSKLKQQRIRSQVSPGMHRPTEGEICLCIRVNKILNLSQAV